MTHRSNSKGFTVIELLVVGVILGTLVFGLGGGCTVSDGTRTGVIQKFSNKGLLVKTWEGEMLLGGLVPRGSSEHRQMVANVWNFTVENPKLIEAVQAAADEGGTVKVSYHQNLLWIPWKGDTCYFVSNITSLSNNASSPNTN